VAGTKLSEMQAKRMLSSVVNKKESEWDDLYLFQLAHLWRRTTCNNEATKYHLCEFLYGGGRLIFYKKKATY